MNQDQVAALLSEVEPSPSPFVVHFSGRSNAKVNGLYKPDRAEIVIHDKNFDSEDQLVYTALHEYAHHLHCARLGGLGQARPHTQEFWSIFHELLAKAEAKGFYRNLFEAEPEFLALTKTIKETCIAVDGRAMLELGRLLAEAAELCRKHKVRFEDYVERVLGLPRATATSAATASRLGLNPSLGWEGLRFAASIRDPDQREIAVAALGEGKCPAAVRGSIGTSSPAVDPADRLLAEKERIERNIRNLNARLEEIERRLAEL